MATSSSLIKTILHKSLAEGVYRDVVTKSSNYYYFLGKTLAWGDELNPPYPVDSYAYERAVRDEIITLKAINPSDVSFVIPRTPWISGTVYDMYDDEYSTQVVGLDIVDGGEAYTSLPTITITGGGGSGAAYTAVVYDGQIIGVDQVSRGYGYTSVPTVTVTGGGGADAIIKAVVNISASGKQKLEDCSFYVVTEDYNVYKCLDNNNNARSMYKPIGASIAPTTTADGYIWKYMFNIPINLRSKFLSESYVPVVSALTNNFYSNGSLESIIINNKGSGYTTASIQVSGDGFRAEESAFLQSVNIIDGGTGWSTPTVLIGDPVSGAIQFVSSTACTLGQKYYNSSYDFYDVVTPGVFSSVEPSHRYGTIQNGTAALKYVGTRAKGTATTSSGAITAVNLIGSVREVNIINGGSGYTTAPSVNFSGGSGSGAVATSMISGSSVLRVIVTNQGDNYTSTPTVTFGTQWTASTAVLIGTQLYYSNRLYTVTQAGTTNTTAPTHTSGEATNGTAKLTYVGQPATGEVVRRFGYGYFEAPTITFTELGGANAVATFQISQSQAKLLPILQDGQVIGVTIDNPGVGYSVAELTVTGDGEGAVLSADLNVGNIQSLQANNEILTTAGTINAIKIISGGYGYGVANISIVGDGTGATATSTIDSASGRIKKINVTNVGSGYTYANIVISGNGHGASARAVMAPFGGHGKNSPDELFATSLMFYSNVSSDLNQGVSVNNDYRQLGIIKNPRVYNAIERFQNLIGSACFIIQGSINTTNFPKDTDLVITRTIGGVSQDMRYRIVSSTSSSALVQSLDNDVPHINDVFQNPTGSTFSATSVGLPTVDKYSGQMMFIDNKAGFTPSTDETVTLRTIIKF